MDVASVQRQGDLARVTAPADVETVDVVMPGAVGAVSDVPVR